MDKPNFIDNLNGNTMVAAIRRVLGAESDAAVVAEPTAKVEMARIATAYFSPGGFARIATAITAVPSVRLLLGTSPIRGDTARWKKPLGVSKERFTQDKLREKLRFQEDDLRAERDHLPFTRDDTDKVRRLIRVLQAGNMEVRRYEDDFLHAKAYIFTSANPEDYEGEKALIAGSSNLTVAGLSLNLELNLGRYDAPTVDKACQWFDALWEKAEPFDLAEFFEEVLQYKDPFEIFLRVLWELYGDEITEERKQDKDLPLTSFQAHGVVRALRLINETGGVIVADEVGLGKTFIAGEILTRYQERRQRALLICPAALRDTAWKNFISEFQLYLEVVSFEGLARDKQLWDTYKRPHASSRQLARPIDEYQLIIIDEAHNYRNPDAPTRAGALRTLLYGKRKDVLMLTATPVNNSLWDLYHLTRFFLKQDAFLADRGILSIKGRFEKAMRENPNDLSPDVLYPIIDATTVKRTRQFIRKHYPKDEITINGIRQTIVFPEPRAISVRYDLDTLLPGLFNSIEQYFDPGSSDCLLFARYKARIYLKQPDADDERIAHAITGLLLSGLLKRFESSTGAFRNSIRRLVEQHRTFLDALSKGYVVGTGFFEEMTGTDDEDFDELLKESDHTDNINLFDSIRLHADVKADLDKLERLLAQLQEITPDKDPKLHALVAELEKIATQADEEGVSREDTMNKRKVLIFSFFADSVRWVRDYLEKVIQQNPKLAGYKDRMDIVVGSGQGEDNSRAVAAAGFAPATAGKPGDEDKTDILISTDVLAEGVNLQQARHIINYDMPWNPMRLVQRHGRIDRIGSQHSRVFMRTIFPVDRLDALLNLEERIARKIAMAAVSVGVVSPLADVSGSQRIFTETREEIKKLLEEDPSLYERGGTVAGTQSGEEYRQTLRKALEKNRNDIVHMPWKAGSGMRRGNEQGIFFCAKAGKRTYLRFVHADASWKPSHYINEEGNENTLIDEELGRCLRMIECSDDEPLVIDDKVQGAAYELWLLARDHIHKRWMHETDPANLQPRLRPLNMKVAEFIRSHIPADMDQDKMKKALDIVESPWPRRDENRLREWFTEEEKQGCEMSALLIAKILESGLEAAPAPDPLPPISPEDIELIVWMGVTATSKNQ